MSSLRGYLMKLLCSLNISTLLRLTVAVSDCAGVETARMREKERVEEGRERALRERAEAEAELKQWKLGI